MPFTDVKTEPIPQLTRPGSSNISVPPPFQYSNNELQHLAAIVFTFDTDMSSTSQGGGGGGSHGRNEQRSSGLQDRSRPTVTDASSPPLAGPIIGGSEESPDYLNAALQSLLGHQPLAAQDTYGNLNPVNPSTPLIPSFPATTDANIYPWLTPSSQELQTQPTVPVQSSLNPYAFLLPQPETQLPIHPSLLTQPPQQSYASSSEAGPSSLQRSRATSMSSGGESVDGSITHEDYSAIAEDKRRRNTAASARFRIKRKQRNLHLERTVSDLQGQADDLEKEVAELRRENRWLKEIVILKGGRAQGEEVAESREGDGGGEDHDDESGDEQAQAE